ncbi:MAG TPA: right-handed parallel beta-helix repeat-containing protein, partial [Elusimicrobiales bacterium]|nr:right-handed parallel beta-helix repeat-containing protein [Elusimicrobiales bacterium]
FRGCAFAVLTDESELVSSGCACDGAAVGVRANGKAWLESNHDIFSRCGCAISLENQSQAHLLGTNFLGMTQQAVKMDGKSTVRSEGCGFRKNDVSVLLEDGAQFDSTADEFSSSKTGLCLNNSAAVRLRSARIKKHRFAGAHLSGSQAELEGCVFTGNSMAVFADCASKATVEACEFLDNRTGLKVDNKTVLSASRTLFKGSSWDAVWGAGESEISLNSCVFRDNRFAVKEDGPCKTRLSEPRFEGKHSAEHLRYPR